MVWGDALVAGFDKELVASRGVFPEASSGSSRRDPTLTFWAFSIVHSPTIRDNS